MIQTKILPVTLIMCKVQYNEEPYAPSPLIIIYIYIQCRFNITKHNYCNPVTMETRMQECGTEVQMSI